MITNKQIKLNKKFANELYDVIFAWSVGTSTKPSNKHTIDVLLKAKKYSELYMKILN